MKAMKTHTIPLGGGQLPALTLFLSVSLLCFFGVSCASGAAGIGLGAEPGSGAELRSSDRPLASAAGDRDEGIFVKKIDSLSSLFIRGADVSSVIALEKSGVIFRNAEGEVQDIFITLKDSGINSVRIRVWNNPFTAEGNGYGGGNCDINTALEIGRRASSCGLSVLLDFHYSDFWADPSKQFPPRAWKDLSLEKKAGALHAYTASCLKKALDSGVDVRMVQIGNETSGTFCGENNWISIAALMRAGCAAVRETAKAERRAIEIAVHFTNPEKVGEYERYVKILEKQKVDYDVFASSYYPWWHGSTENLTAVLTRVALLSGKKVMCAETSYAWTEEDGDGFPNTISRDTACAKPYPLTVQGQADAVRDVIAAVSAVGKAGIGVYYWEPAWIPVPLEDLGGRRALWEKWGSGWASSYAGEYDPNDAGKYYGGSSWDNQAMFDFTGRPLASLSVWRLASGGSVTALRPDAVFDTPVRTRLGDRVSLPSEVTVQYNDGSRKRTGVVWETEGMRTDTGADTDGPGGTDGPDGEQRVPVADMGKRTCAEYAVYGLLSDADIGGKGVTVRALAKISILEKNYVENGGFEDADISMWKIENTGGVTTELFVQDKTTDAKTGKNALHFWSKDKVSFTVEQTVSGLDAGNYKFSLSIHGGDIKNPDMYIYARSGGKKYRAETDVDGWRNFRIPVISGIRVSDGKVTIGAHISCGEGGWGSLDDFALSPSD